MKVLRTLILAIATILAGCANVSSAADTAPRVAAWDQEDTTVLFLMDSQTWCKTVDDAAWRDLVLEDRAEGSRYEGCWYILPDAATLRVYVHPMGFGTRPLQGLEFKKPPPFQPSMTREEPRNAPAKPSGIPS